MFEEGSTSRNVSYFVPGVGTVLSVQDAIKDPTWQNIGMAGLSALGDATSVFGFGNAIRAAAAASKAASRANKAFKIMSNTEKVALKAENAFKSSAKVANKLQNRASFAPIKLIPKFQREANVASANARQAQSAYGLALKNLNGTSLLQVVVKHNLPGGGTMYKKTIMPIEPRVKTGAVGAYQKASSVAGEAALQAKAARPGFFIPAAATLPKLLRPSIFNNYELDNRK